MNFIYDRHVHNLDTVRYNSPAGRAFLGVYTYNILIANIILLPILILIFAKRVHRHATLINVAVTYVLSGVASDLLFFVGKQTGPEPSRGLCIAQTSMLYAATPMWSVSVFVMVLHVAVTMRSKMDVSRPKMYLMLVAPYVAGILFSLAALVLALEPNSVVGRNRRFFYCSLFHDPLSNAMLGITSGFLLSATLMEGWVAVNLFRNWRAASQAGHDTGVNPIHLVIRVLVFGAYILCGMCVSLITIFDPRSLVPDIFASTIGVAFLLTFGTQRDVIEVFSPFQWKRSCQNSCNRTILQKEAMVASVGMPISITYGTRIDLNEC